MLSWGAVVPWPPALIPPPVGPPPVWPPVPGRKSSLL